MRRFLPPVVVAFSLAYLAVLAKAEDAAFYVNRGKALLAKGEYDEAIADYSEAIRLKPDDAAAYDGRGYAWQRKGDDDKAQADYRQSALLRRSAKPRPKDEEAIRRNAQDAAFYVNRGKALLAKGEYDEALSDFDEAIRLDPDSADAYWNRGSALGRKSESSKSLKDFMRAQALYAKGLREGAYDKAVLGNPKDATAYNNRGLALSRTRAFDKAIADFDEAIRLDPNFAEAYLNRGYAYRSRRPTEYDKPIADYSEAIRLDPKNPAAYVGRAEEWEFKGEYDKAIADCDEAIRLDPKCAGAYDSRARAWQKKGERAGSISARTEARMKALADDVEAFRLNPRLDEPKQSLPFMVDDRNLDYKEEILAVANAIHEANEAIRRDPKDANAYNRRGLAWRRIGSGSQLAIADFTEAIRLDPKFAEAYANRGATLSKSYAFNKAIPDFREAIRLDPNCAEAYNGLAWFQATPVSPGGGFDEVAGKEALANAKKAQEISGGKNWRYLHTLAAAYAETGDFKSAVKWQRTAIELAAKDKTAPLAEVGTLDRDLNLFEQGKPYHRTGGR